MIINMTRRSGAIGIPCIEQIDRRDIWRVRTDIQPEYDEQSKEQTGVSFVEHEFRHKPSIAEVKEFVLGVINKKTDEKILSGFVYNNLSIWLSEENQMNWAQAKCPAVFKIGEQVDGTPIYHNFETQEEMTQFYNACILWKQQCLVDGWVEKDAVDWTPYEEALS